MVQGGFQCGVEATGWKLDGLLRSMFYLLRDSPARRDDFTTVTGSTLFPLKLCGTGWLEDVPVAKSTADMEPHFQIYYNNSSRYKEQVPKIQSFYNVMQHIQNPLTPANLTSLDVLQKLLHLFLQKFQTDKLMASFLREEQLKTIMAILIKEL